MASGFQVADLLWLRNVVNIPSHLELDPWGNLIVTPTDDQHGRAISFLNVQAVRQIAHPEGRVWCGDFAWQIPGGSRYWNVPDLTILAPGWRRVDEWHVDPPPLLVVEVASPSTVNIDRGRKRDDYRLGGAGLYVRVDFFDAGQAGFEVYDFATDEVRVPTTAIDLDVGDGPLRFDLSDLPPG